MGGEPHNFPIAITGMHRSGTSMITRALHDSGLQLVGSGAEELIDAAEDNPEGFWENKAIVACNDELLETTGGAWDNPPVLLPQAADDPRVAHLAPAGAAALMALSGHEHWGFKDPRLCLTASFWLDLQPDLLFVICVRHPLEVALSLKRRNQNSYSLGLALWERYYASVLELVPPERRIVTHYDTYFVDARAELARLSEFAGLRAASARVRSDLRHHTIDVGLADAGVSPGLRALYSDLCREAGAPLAAEAAPDEGRVRRLILDGTVAARHAEQRQAAVGRLQQREEEFRAEHRATLESLQRDRAAAEAEQRATVQSLQRDRAAAEAEHRERIRDLERKLAETRDAAARERDAAARKLEAIHAETLTTMRSLATSTARTQATIERMDRQRLTSRAKRTARRVLRGGDRVVQPVERRLPQPARQRAGQVRRVVRRGAAAPGPTAKSVGRRVAPKVTKATATARSTAGATARSAARSAAHRLPPSARATLRVQRARVSNARAHPIPTARRVVRRLPPPAQDLARRAWQRSAGLRARAQARPKYPDEVPKPAPTPKGPAVGTWKDAYLRMVVALPEHGPWLVIAPGSPPEVRDARTPRGTMFPSGRKARPLVNDLAHIAHLEALRHDGHRYLVLPEGSRPWFRQQAELRDHVVSTYLTLEDRTGAGAVFDLTRPAIGEQRSLRAEIQRLGRGEAYTPAVLAWTDLDVARELPGVTTFRPPAGDRLPYLDDTVDIVVVDETHDPEEARRVATRGVITLSLGGDTTGMHVLDLPATNGGTASAHDQPRVIVWAMPGGDDAWQAMLTERAEAAGAEVRIGPIDQDTRPDLATVDVAIVVEPGVLVLPGTLEAATTLVTARPDAALAGKVLRGDGRLEAAGGTVFSDRSVGLIAAGSEDVRAPWHDYTRAVCWGPGLVAAAGPLWSEIIVTPETTGRAFLREWCAAVWEKGGSVIYEPSVAAVRVTGDGGEPSTPLERSRWQRVLDLRPNRPAHLGDGEWRYLLAHDDVEACRR